MDHSCFLLLLFILGTLHSLSSEVTSPPTSSVNKLRLPGFTLNWLDEKMEYRAGDAAVIKITPWDDSTTASDSGASFDRYVTDFVVSVMGKKGNSTYVSNVISHSEGDPSFWNITLVPIMTGRFSLIVTEVNSGASDSTLHFRILPGPLHPSACIPFWLNNVNEYIAGTKATVFIRPKDAFGNNILWSDIESKSFDNFSVAAFHQNGTAAVIVELNYTGWKKLGIFIIEFIPASAGTLLLHVLGENLPLRESPLPFKVKPGSLVMKKCVGKWKYETNVLQIFSKLEFYIYQKDQFGNLVSGLYPFDARVIKKSNNLSIPISDIFFLETEPGIQLLSFEVSEPGDFMLVVFDDANKENISDTPYEFTVFVGYCHESNSVINGSGLLTSVAGQQSNFTVYLQDIYHNPSPMRVEKLHIQILKVNDSVSVHANIVSLMNLNDSEGLSHALPPSNENNDSTGNLTVESSTFKVSYTPEKSGAYEIWVFCGNIPLNKAQSFSMITYPDFPNMFLSRVMEPFPRVKKLVRNEIIVKLVDSYKNPIPSKENQLIFKFQPSNYSDFQTWAFTYQAEGFYRGYYLARNIGTYKISISYEGKNILPSPFEISIYEREYFPIACNDSISVWEDSSVDFDVLGNDHYSGTNASIINSTIPIHGTLLQYGQLFRYTPYKGFSGNDSFSYSISDTDHNVAVGTVEVSTLHLPPQFDSLPTNLQAIEDTISPKSGGFLGFSLKYSDSTENISMTLSVKFGTIFLAPMSLQVWPPMGSKLYIGRITQKDLNLAGTIEVINSALQSIQYLGNENFYGNDILSLHASNKNGMQDTYVPIFVEAVNDPPFIHVPNFVAFDEKDMKEGVQIFEKHKNLFDSFIGDSDILNFPENNSYFSVALSMEVNDGVLIMGLPDKLRDTVEVKIEKSYHWQHLQSFVTISNHFLVQAKGIRIHGSIEECNTAMQHLVYQGIGGVILTITVNDMGNYGISPNYTEKMGLPLSSEVVVNIIKRKPITFVSDHFLGSAIIAEFILMLFLGGILLFFVCKCTNALGMEKRDNNFKNPEDGTHEENHAPRWLNASYSTALTNVDSFGRPVNPNFRQRSSSCRKLKAEEGSSLIQKNERTTSYPMKEVASSFSIENDNRNESLIY